MEENESNENQEGAIPDIPTDNSTSCQPENLSTDESTAATIETSPGEENQGASCQPPQQMPTSSQPADVLCSVVSSAAASSATPCEEECPLPIDVCRMILLGRTGEGKSSTGNSIIGFKHYVARSAFKSITTDCRWQSARRFAIEIEIIDTPGFFDTAVPEETLKEEIAKCMLLASPGPHVFLVVIRIDVRFTDEEANTVHQIRSVFGNNIMRHLILVFTHGDNLEENESIEDRLKDGPPALKRLIEEAEGRYVVFDNTAALPQEKKNEQLKQLLLKVRDVLSATGGQHYSSPMLVRCHESVVACAKRIAQILEGSSANETAQALLRACVESAYSTEQLVKVFQRRDEGLSSQLKELKEILKTWKHDKALSEWQIKELARELESTKQLVKKQKKELDAEKKSWKFCILM